jgi:predicted nucleic acid-binding protein
MIFTDLPTGAAVLLDANTLVYHFSRDPHLGSACTAKLDRIERQDLLGLTTTHVLSETAHRLMTLEAIAVLNWTAAGIGNRLRTHPAEVSRLSLFRQAIEKVLQGNLQVLPVALNLLAVAVALCQQIGLLTNDGLLVPLCRRTA